MIDETKDVNAVRELIEIQELESKVAPNIVWST
jgi:hypothetical protein